MSGDRFHSRVLLTIGWLVAASGKERIYVAEENQSKRYHISSKRWRIRTISTPSYRWLSSCPL